MIVNILGNWLVKVDSNNYTLIEKYWTTDKEGERKMRQKTVGYFNSIDSALDRVARLETIRQNEKAVIEIKDYIRQLIDTREMLADVVKGVAL